MATEYQITIGRRYASNPHRQGENFYPIFRMLLVDEEKGPDHWHQIDAMRDLIRFPVAGHWFRKPSSGELYLTSDPVGGICGVLQDVYWPFRVAFTGKFTPVLRGYYDSRIHLYKIDRIT